MWLCWVVHIRSTTCEKELQVHHEPPKNILFYCIISWMHAWMNECKWMNIVNHVSMSRVGTTIPFGNYQVAKWFLYQLLRGMCPNLDEWEIPLYLLLWVRYEFSSFIVRRNRSYGICLSIHYWKSAIFMHAFIIWLLYMS